MRIKYYILTGLLCLTTLLAGGQNKQRTTEPLPQTKSEDKNRSKDPQTKVKPQTPEEEAEEGTMNAAWKPVIMDHYFGIRGGYGFGKDRFEPARQSKSYNGLLNFGLVYRFDAPAQKYVGCIEVDINYLQKGYQYETYAESGITYSRQMTVIEIPILWQPYLPLSSKNRASRIYLSAGPYVGYCLSSKYRIFKTEDDSQTIEEGKYDYNSSRDNRFECGVVVGGGFQVAVKRLTLGLEFRYNIMLSNVLKGVSTYAGNPFFSPVDAMNVSFGVTYKILSGEKKVKKE